MKTCKVSVSFTFDWPEGHEKKILGPKVAGKDRKNENRISMPDIFQIRGSPLWFFFGKVLGTCFPCDDDDGFLLPFAFALGFRVCPCVVPATHHTL